MIGRRSPLLAACLVGVVLAANGCGGSDGGSEGVDASSTTTMPAGTTSTTAAPARVEQVLAALMEVRNAAFASPDPARVEDYALPECNCVAGDRSGLKGLQDRGHRWTTPVLELMGAKVANRPGPDEVALTAVAGRPPEKVVDAKGKQVGKLGEGIPPSGFRFVLKRLDGRWRFSEVGPQPLLQAEIDAIRTAGIPSGPPDATSQALAGGTRRARLTASSRPGLGGQARSRVTVTAVGAAAAPGRLGRRASP